MGMPFMPVHPRGRKSSAMQQHARLPCLAKVIESPLGMLTLLAQGEALCEIRFDAHVCGHEQLGSSPVLEQSAAELEQYFDGTRTAFTVRLAPPGTVFQRLVWQTMVDTVPYGQTVSYGELAKRCDRPGAARAVGMANHVNPIPIFIPCHRVVNHSGKVVGEGSGIQNRRRLLALESRLST